MLDLVTTLVPLAVGSAVLPVQLAVTMLLLRGRAGRVAAVAWVAGMTVVRLVQGIAFGFVFDAVHKTEVAEGGPGVASSILQVVLAILFYAIAAKAYLKVPDEDAPPPRWMTAIEGVTATRAFLLGAGVVLISAKLWVFTLGAVGAIKEADLTTAGSVGAFLLFVLLAESLHLGILGFALAAPTRADIALARWSDLLARYGRAIMTALGLVFGTWFLLKGLSGIGIF